MATLSGFRNLFQRRHDDVTHDFDETQARSLAQTMHGGVDAGPLVEPKPSRRPQDELLTAIGRIDTHLAAQSARSDDLVRLLERLPQAIEAVPELNRRQAQLLEALTDQAAENRKRDLALHETLDRLSAIAEQHTELLGLVQQQIDTGRQITTRIAEQLATLPPTLADLASTSERSLTQVAELRTAQRDQEENVTLLIGRTRRWTITAAACSAAAVVLAATAAVLVALRGFQL